MINERSSLESIDVDEFLKIWRGDYKDNSGYNKYYTVDTLGVDVVTFSNCDIYGEVRFLAIKNLPSLHMTNCKVSAFFLENCSVDLVNIDNSEFGNIIIYNKSVTGNINVEDSSTGFISIDNNTVIGNLVIKSSFIEGFISVDNSSTVGSVEIFSLSNTNEISVNNKSEIGDIKVSTESKVGNINISRSYSQCIGISDAARVGGVTIDKNSVSGNVTVSSSSMLKSLYIIDSRIKNIEVEDHSQCLDIQIFNESITGYVSINSKSTLESFRVRDSSETGYISVKGESGIEYITIDNHSLTGVLSVYKSTVGNISINNCSKVFGVVLEYLTNESKQLSISNSYIEQLLLGLDRPFKITVNDHSQILKLDLKGCVLSKDVVFQISDTQLNEISLNSFINQGIIAFNNISALNEFNKFNDIESRPLLNELGHYGFEIVKKYSELKIINSDLGKMQFIGCDFKSFDRVILLNSKLLEIFTADTIFPDIAKLGTVDKVNNGEYMFIDTLNISARRENRRIVNAKYLHLLGQQRLACSQIKKIFENRGDVVRAIEFHAYELEVYRQYLKRKPMGSRRDWWNNNCEYINLSLNRYSNHYGNNWLRAVAVALGLNMVLFTFYCWSLGFWFGSNSNIFFKLASYSFEFLNPLRKADFLSEMAESTNLGRVIDYLSRIIMAYLVYQTIQSFRKFGKKTV